MPFARRISPMTAALLLGACLAAGPAMAQWKWRDDHGRVQYSDRPPPAGIPDKNILAKPPGFDKPQVVVVTPLGAAASAPAAAASAPKARPTEGAVEAKRREAAAAEDAQRAAEAARMTKQQADNCQRAREYARSLESGMRIARVDANGERVYIDDAQRAQEMNRAREVIASDCKP